MNKNTQLLLLGLGALWLLSRNDVAATSMPSSNTGSTPSGSDVVAATQGDTASADHVVAAVQQQQQQGKSNLDIYNNLVDQYNQQVTTTPTASNNSSPDYVIKVVDNTPAFHNVTYSGAAAVANDKAVAAANDWNTANRYNPTTGKFY